MAKRPSVLCIVASLAAGAPASGELIVNGGFEAGTLDGFSTGLGRDIVITELEGAASGRYAALFDYPGKLTLAQKMNGVAQEWIEAIGFINVLDIEGGVDSGFVIELRERLDGGVLASSVFVAPTAGWRAFSLGAQIPSNGAFWLVAEFGDVGAGRVLLDELRVTGAPAPAAAVCVLAGLLAFGRRR